MFFHRIESGIFSAEENMRVDSELLQRAETTGESFFRTYNWDKPSVTLGCFQKIEKAINIDYCKKNDIPIVRRPTGGKAILHLNDFTYSVVFGKKISGGKIKDYYKIVNTALNNALNEIELPSQINKTPLKKDFKTPLCFEHSSEFEISFNNKKIAGTAQRVLKNAVLVQGTIPLKQNTALIKKIFIFKNRIDDEFFFDKQNLTFQIENMDIRKLSELFYKHIIEI